MSSTAASSIGWTTRPAAKSRQFRIGGDLSINRLGYGTMRLTGTGIWGPPKDRKEAVRILQRAVELGINFFDTADSYGPGVAEEIIAEALYPYPAGLVIATKAGFDRPGPDKWVTNGRPEHLREACEGSLKRLRLDRIELFQLHRIDDKVPADDQLGALRNLQSEGKIKHIGLSEVTVEQIGHACKLVPIVSVQNRYSVLDRAAEDVLDYCERANLGFIPWFPLAAGDVSKAGNQVEQAAAKLRHVSVERVVRLAELFIAQAVYHADAIFERVAEQFHDCVPVGRRRGLRRRRIFQTSTERIVRRGVHKPRSGWGANSTHGPSLHPRNWRTCFWLYRRRCESSGSRVCAKNTRRS